MKSLPVIRDTHRLDNEEVFATRLDADAITQYNIEKTRFWERNEQLTADLNKAERAERKRNPFDDHSDDYDSDESYDDWMDHPLGFERSNKRLCGLCPLNMKREVRRNFGGRVRSATDARSLDNGTRGLGNTHSQQVRIPTPLLTADASTDFP